MKFKSLSVLLLLIALFQGELAANEVNYLNVEGGNVYFSTTASKAGSAPSCAAASTNEQYAISLNNESGKALYSLLITAMASKQGVNVVSAGDCADVTGFERALGVSISPVSSSSDSSSDLYLYLADGTELGLITGTDSRYVITYLPTGRDSHFMSAILPVGVDRLFFESADCSGMAYSYHRGVQAHQHYNNSNLFQTISTTSVNIKSKLEHDGSCSAHTERQSLYGVYDNQSNTAICGTKLCVIKRK